MRSASLVLLASVLALGGCGELKSQFLAGHPCAVAVMAGTPYDMNDPGWLTSDFKQNRDVCAYKFFAGFFTAGYNTEIGVTMSGDDPHLRVLQEFKKQQGLDSTSFMNAETLAKLDDLIASLEPKIAALAAKFPFIDRMQVMHPNDVSKETVAAIHALPFSVLPPKFAMSLDETIFCVVVQCVGSLQDAEGNALVSTPLAPDVDYRFVGAYFDPKVANSRLPSASVPVGAVLHEFAHYIDGQGTKFPAFPVKASVDTNTFYIFNYFHPKDSGSCAPRSTDDPMAWISFYGFSGDTSNECDPGQSHVSEEWAESFAAYVAAGKRFNAARQSRTQIDRKYIMLKHILDQREYDSDVISGTHSGCTDVPNPLHLQPGYLSCSESYVFNWTLPTK